MCVGGADHNTDLDPRTEAHTDFDPFRRHDVLGDMGLTPLRGWHGVRTRIALVLLAPLKIMLAMSMVAVASSMYYTLPIRIASAGCRMCGHLCLFFLGFGRMRMVDLHDKRQDTPPAVYVANHTSWLDIIVAVALYSPGFVAKNGTQDMAIIGTLANKLGCLYVDREGGLKGRSGKVAAVVKHRVETIASEPGQHRPLLLFPEGTTTNGKYLLPFKTGAFLAGAPVQPLLFRYRERNVSCAWETIGGLWHVMLVAAQMNSVTVYRLPVYVPNEEEARNPKLYASNVRAEMARVGDWLELSNSSLPDKRAYQDLLRARCDTAKSKES